MGINTLVLSGRLGAQPEIKYLESGKVIASVNIAVDTWKNKAKATMWIRLKAFGKTAEFMGEYLKKGMLVTASGKLDIEEWQDQEGSKRMAVCLLVNDIQLPAKAEVNTSKESGGYICEADIPF